MVFQRHAMLTPISLARRPLGRFTDGVVPEHEARKRTDCSVDGAHNGELLHAVAVGIPLILRSIRAETPTTCWQWEARQKKDGGIREYQRDQEGHDEYTWRRKRK